MKRRNMERWMQARLGRLDAKLNAGPCYFRDMSSESMENCRVRAHRLACDLQILRGQKAAAIRLGKTFAA